MNKEELREMIRTEKDGKILSALWELYELKFGSFSSNYSSGNSYLWANSLTNK